MVTVLLTLFVKDHDDLEYDSFKLASRIFKNKKQFPFLFGFDHSHVYKHEYFITMCHNRRCVASVFLLIVKG